MSNENETVENMATKTEDNCSDGSKVETTKTVIAVNRGGWSLRRKRKSKFDSFTYISTCTITYIKQR